ncbi:MAG TPA: DNA polymerase I [Candidatus Paceibacterota bacterium]|nr:DNA polymerase I [Candidatus Paceibacterota bacterium]
MKKLVLIDGHALVHRAFHALPPLATSSGVPTNAVFGFMSVLIKMIKDVQPEYIAAAFDLAGPTFRHEEFAEYKSHRVKAPDELHAQVPYIKELLAAFGIPIFEKAGFEADDVIGALSEQAKEHKNLQTIIMTGDLDTLQLVEGKKVVVWTLRKGVTDTVTYDESEVEKRYGLSPEQLIDFKGLKGDPSDNIPGVPGIGEKTASALIKEFGSLDDLYRALEKKGKKPKILTEKLSQKLIDNKDQAFFSKKLATIIRDVDIHFSLDEAQWRSHLDRSGLEGMLKDLALYSTVKRLAEIEEAGAQTKSPAAPATLFEASVPSTLVADEREILAHLTALKKAREIVFDITQEVIVVAAISENAIAFSEMAAGDKAIGAGLAEILTDPDIGKLVHDTKAIVRWGLKRGWMPTGFVFDVKLAAYVLNSDTRDYALERLYFAEFNQDVSGGFSARADHLAKLAQRYRERLKNLHTASVLTDIELPLSPVLARMEAIGILVDDKIATGLGAKVAAEISILETQIHGMAGSAFNINSPQQLSGILFDTLGLRGKVKKTGKGAKSTAAGELEKLVDEHPIVALILKYRELQKLKTTYIDPLPSLIDPADHRIHTTYNQTGATTGRLSSQDPNLQNIPIRTELGQEFRKAFIARPGWKLVSCDYSQLELRIAAHISGDKEMTEAFRRGEDIHTRTAADVFRVKPELVTKEMRRQAKVLNFGVLYGMGILGFQRAAGVGRDEARLFIQNYMHEFAGLARYMEDTKALARRQGWVETVFGRRRLLPDIHSTMPAVQAAAERMAINMPVQGTSADLIKLAMIEIQKLIDAAYAGQAAMLLQVHDELLFEVKQDMVAEITPKIVEIMQSVREFKVPIVVDAKIGANWAEMEKL